MQLIYSRVLATRPLLRREVQTQPPQFKINVQPYVARLDEERRVFCTFDIYFFGTQQILNGIDLGSHFSLPSNRFSPDNTWAKTGHRILLDSTNCLAVKICPHLYGLSTPHTYTSISFYQRWVLKHRHNNFHSILFGLNLFSSLEVCGGRSSRALSIVYQQGEDPGSSFSSDRHPN